MSDLDKKLEELEVRMDDGVWHSLSKDAIAEITQAFVDAGWVHVSKDVTEAAKDYAELGVAIQLKQGYMTGQEWYDRFVKALEYEQFEHWDDKDIALNAAKEAAGIEE